MKRITVTFISLLVFFYVAPAQDGPVTSDEEFFAHALNLDCPGLENVKADVEKGDWSSARKDFVTYLKVREKPLWHFDWRDRTSPSNLNPSYDTSEADKYASNLLVSCGVWHQFGQTVDWSINPTELKYNEWTWQLSRHPFWTVLGDAYWATGDEKYARAFVSQMRSWVIQNPLPDEAANKPYSRWRTIETGIRMLGSWPNAFFRFLSSPSFDDDSIIMMVKSFYEHAIHLRAFPHSNNWLTMEMDGLFHVGILFPEFKLSSQWCEYASSRMYEQSKVQFYPDGAQKELACGYHGVSLKNMLKIYPISLLNGYRLPDDYVLSMENCYNYYVNIMLPEGCMPALNDSGWGNVRSVLSGVCDYFPENKSFKYIATEGREGVEPDFKSVWMPWAGWAVMRSGWGKDDLYSIMEVGPLGAAHYHEDKLSVILSAYGKRLLTEGGTYAYDTSDWRRYILSARAHNVARVDGNDQSRTTYRDRPELRVSPEPLQNRWISNDKFDFAEGWYRDGFGPAHDRTVTHYRALTFLKKHSCWLLVDIFTPTDDEEHSYQTWFHLNSVECEETLNGGYASCDRQQANLSIVPLRKDSPAGRLVMGQKTPEVQGWIPKGGTDVYDCIPVATPTFSRKAAGQCAEPYILCPSKPGEGQRIRKIKTVKDGFLIRFNDGTSERINFKTGKDSLEELVIGGEKVI